MSSEAEAPRERLFFALWPDEPVREALRRAPGKALERCGGRKVRYDNLHLTLAFAGSVTADGRACLERLADGLALPPFTLVLDTLGWFPRARAVWLGSSHPPAELVSLAQALNEGFPGCALEAERRPFRVHLTLMRKARRGPAVETVAPVRWPVGDFALVRSVTHREGPEYQVLRRWRLKPGLGTAHPL